MQPAKDRFGSDGIRLAAAMARIGDREDEGTDRRIDSSRCFAKMLSRS
jgi:hypothetical protein